MSSKMQQPGFGQQGGEGEKASIIKDAQRFEQVVEEFRLDNIKPTVRREDAKVYSRYGATAHDTSHLSQKDSRFELSRHTRDALEVSQEEKRLIDDQVENRVAGMAESARRQGDERGYKEGLARGREEAFKQFRVDGEKRLKQLDSLLAEMEGAKTAVFKQNERFLVDLIYRISKMVLLRELATDRGYLTRLASELIEKQGLKENLFLKIHPKDAESIELIKEGVQKSLGALRNLNIEVSQEVREGGCWLETEWGAIDASLETQLGEILAALGGGLKPAPAPGGEKA